ncbi:glycosyltransferase family 4 protein [Candidatus Puniceispirillum sp.]|nr:glycosyltransferase family 4 protein [Candidatus Puniceispirillum sp.]
MNLLIISQYFYPENFRINELVADFIKRGHKITVLTGLPNYPQGKFYHGYGWMGPWKEQLFGASIIRVPMLPRFSGTWWQLFLNYISFALVASICIFWRVSRKQSAIIVFQTSPATVGFPAILASKIIGVPVFFWILDLWPESLRATKAIESLFLLNAVNYWVKWVYARCEILFISSRSFSKSLKLQGIQTDKIKYLPNWIEKDYEAHQSICKKKELEYFKIVYAGNIGVAQDLPSLLKAASKLANCLPEIRWQIVGDGRLLSWFKSEVSRLDLDKIIEFSGQLPANELPKIFDKADALLVTLCDDPVVSLTVPGKVQTYMASGKPILAMINGEGAKIIFDSGGGFVADASDVDHFCENVIKLASKTTEQRKNIGEAGRKYALKEFDRKKILDRLERIIEKSLNNEQ